MHLYLSPHLDDAVLSCGGAIAARIASGDAVTVVSVCAGAPHASASKLAEELHRLWGLDSASVNRVRRSEDELALAGLGARAIQLDLLEAIYRLPSKYSDYEALFAEPAPDDPLLQELDSRLAPLLDGAAVIHAPLSVGGHVDHRLVHRYARTLGRTVYFYEEIPYVMRPGDLERCLASIDLELVPQSVEITSFAPEKLRAIARYASQLRALFGSAEAMPHKVLEHARAVAEISGLSNALAERVWCAAR